MKQIIGSLTEERPEEPTATPLEQLLDAAVAPGRPSPPSEINNARVGTVVGFADDGAIPLVTYTGQPGSAALPASAVIDMEAEHIGRRVVLMFEGGDPLRPLIIGCLHDQRSERPPAGVPQVELEADGERLVLSATRQMVLRCGKASITLTCDGKILLHGSYISNRSSGVVRIKGGAVHIN
jgi:hypothetical protein